MNKKDIVFNKHLWEHSEKKKRMSDAAVRAPSGLAREYGTWVEEIRALPVNHKMVMGIVSGTDALGNETPEIEHYLVGVTGCRKFSNGDCNGYANVKAFWYNEANVRNPRYSMSDISQEKFMSKDIFSTPLQAVADKDGTLIRSWFQPGFMNKNGTCNNTTCKHKNCIAYYNLRKKMTPEDRAAEDAINAPKTVAPSQYKRAPVSRQKQEAKHSRGTSRKGSQSANDSEDEQISASDGGDAAQSGAEGDGGDDSENMSAEELYSDSEEEEDSSSDGDLKPDEFVGLELGKKPSDRKSLKVAVNRMALKVNDFKGKFKAMHTEKRKAQKQIAQLRKSHTSSEKTEAHLRKILAQIVQTIGPYAKGRVITSAPASGSGKGKERKEKAVRGAGEGGAGGGED